MEHEESSSSPTQRSGKKDQIEVPAIASKKQARVWNSQAFNACFETGVLGKYKEAILDECYPSKSDRKSGDYHLSKCLGLLSHLD